MIDRVVCATLVVNFLGLAQYATAASQHFNATKEPLKPTRRVGDICDPRVYYDEVPNDSSIYWQCSVREQNWKGVGEWEQKQCPSETHFVVRLQRCENSTTIRRQQQSLCSQYNTVNCFNQQQPQTCNVGFNPTLGGQCNWQSSTFSIDPYSNAYFMQCNPTTSGALCGVWQRTPCPSGTIFDVARQVCVSTALQSNCVSNQMALCPCGTNQRCPGVSSCYQQTCCLPPRPFTPQAPRLCPNGAPPRGFCAANAQCFGFGYNHQCLAGVCCAVLPNIPPPQPYIPQPVPVPVPNPVPTCIDGQLPLQVCGIGGQCPQSQYCSQVGQCCPLSRCPSGDIPVAACLSGRPCPLNTQCINNGCCPLPLPVCPNGAMAARACRGNEPTSCDFGATGLYCYSNEAGYQGCCPVPRCPTGAPALGPCANGISCPVGASCINGACCRAPQCPDGTPGSQICSGLSPNECPAGFLCVGNTCCGMRCSDNTIPIRACITQQECPPGSACENGMCCRLRVCPNGQPALERCVGTGVTTCPNGYGCYNGGCCRIALCPTGEPSVQSCIGAGQANCPLGFACVNEMCCRSQSCPNGELVLQSCAGPGTCPLGFGCINGGCCRQALPPPQIPPPVPAQAIPLCPSGVPPSGMCLPGTISCMGGGTYCMDGLCCPSYSPSLPVFAQPFLQTCPNGLPAAQACAGYGQGTCAPGHECVAGMCCPVAVAVQTNAAGCAQAQWQPICYCAAYNSVCPSQTVCQSGMCCASPNSPLFNTVRPGDRCTTAAQCPGSFSSCINGYCICVGNSRSNGVQCVPYARQTKKLREYKPGRNCGQFGADCEKIDTVVKRSHKRLENVAVDTNDSMRQLGIDDKDDPAFWYVPTTKRHHCKSDADCTPDLTCVDSACLPYLSLGDKGCTSSLQCSRVNLGATCEFSSVQNTTICHCQLSWFRVNEKCAQTCPPNTVADGSTCVDAEEQAKSKSILLNEFTSRIANLFGSPKRN